MTSTTGTCARFTYWSEPAGPHDDDSPTVVIDLEGTGPDEHIFKLIRDHGRFYESDLLQHLAHHGPRGGVYVDVGANIGNHSVFFGRFLAAQVIAIEPNLHLLPLLERNLRVNAVSDWTTLAVAIGARSGAGRLRPRPGYARNSGAQEVVPADALPTGAVVEIDTLDHVLEKLGAEAVADVSLVKLDIEGMELDALHGAVDLLEHQRPDVVVEAAGEAQHVSVGSFLSEYGYRQVARFCSTPTYHFSSPTRSFPRGSRPTVTKEYS